ncbi:MAG: sugar phosphate isomerase/epimerase [Lentisphaerae bacterium]|nr:sugar phosphate isomerase/epimerase [Lentisphaerota bacterium]MCP4103456.1 sugar phosphate isomerase/epimerase [Lentisphaerota bacterium]
MMRIGVADFGMNVWDGGLYDIEDRLINLKELGFDGTERLEAASPADAIYRSALYKKLGMDFSTCRGPNVECNIQWTAALGKEYIWMTPGKNDREIEFDKFVRRSKALCKAAARHGITVGIHNHMYQRVQDHSELVDYLEAIPEARIVFDTGHLSMAGGDPVEIVKKYHNRICVMHLKDVFLPGGKRDDGIDNYRFCELGAGNNGFDNTAVLEALLETGWDGWIHIEHDLHQREPLVDLKTSINFVKSVIGA